MGELSDRLSILALKILFGEEQGKDVAHFKVEQGAILTQVRTRTLNGKWFEAYTELAATNAALWHAEDDLRTHRGRGEEARTPILWEAVGKVAVRIQALNDRRAVLIATINRDAGDGDQQEKL